MSAFSAAAADEDGDTISALRAENEQLRQSLLAMHNTLEMTARAGAHHAMAAECLRETVIRWASRAEQAEDMLEAIGAGGVGKVGQPQVEQGPVAWMDTETRVLYDHDTSKVDQHLGFKPTVPLYTHPQNLRCKSEQARLATLWGYVKAKT